MGPGTKPRQNAGRSVVGHDVTTAGHLGLGPQPHAESLVLPEELWQKQSHSHPVPSPCLWDRGLFPDCTRSCRASGAGVASRPCLWGCCSGGGCTGPGGKPGRQDGPAGAPHRLGLPDTAQHLCVLSCAWINSTGPGPRRWGPRPGVPAVPLCSRGLCSGGCSELGCGDGLE